MDDPVAVRISRRFVEARGYLVGTAPELAPLEPACDFLLTKHDGLTFSIVAIVDAERDDERRFDVEPDRIHEVLAACCERYSGSVGGAKQPAVLVVVEVRTESDEAKQRLRGYSNRTFDRNAVHAFVVDTARDKVVTATKFSFIAGWGWRRFLVREARALD